MAFFENNQNPKESYYYDNFDILKVGMHLFSGEKNIFYLILRQVTVGYPIQKLLSTKIEFIVP